MERNREARRGSMAVMNGGLSRRRQRSSSLRDSPEEDGAMDMQETGRLRERGSKKDRDRERLSRNKRRRGDRMMHGSNREEGADTSDGSLEEDDDDEEEEALMPVRLPPAPSSIPASSSLPPSNHLRKSFPAKVVRAPAVWKADEMIGVPIPRKARSGTAKRSHDCWASGGGSGGGGSGEASHRQPPPNSPSRQSHASTGPMSPSSSNASVRKKIKNISGSKPQKPAKMAKSSSIQEIEIEVAEVLFGMTRQLQAKPEGHKPDSKETNGSGNDAKSRVSSPISNSQATGSSQPTMPNSNSNPAPVVVTAPKRKRPRPVKFEDESPTSPVSSTAITSAPLAPGTKTDSEVLVKAESSSPRTEKTTPSPINDNGGSLLDLGVPQVTSMSASTDRLQEPPKADGESVLDSVVPERIATIDENVAHVKQPAFADLDVNLDDDRGKKDDMGAEKQKEEKFSIDLMAPPPGKLSPERDTFPDPAAEPKPVDSEMKLKIQLSGRLEEKREGKPEVSEMLHAVRRERILDLQIDLDKHGKEMAGSSKQQVQKQQMKPSGRMDAKPDGKSSGNASGSVPVPLPVGSWPSNVPPYGYMGHVPSLPAVLPIDGSSGSTKTIQAPNFLSVQTRPSRCVTHCYIAQNIFYHQQIAKMNPFWTAAAGTMPLYGAKPYNLNAIPPSESTSIPANSLQGSFPVRNSGPLLDKGAHPSREKSSSTANPQTETTQRKQHPMQQLTPPASVNNLLHGPAFIFSLNQQAAGAAASVIRSAGPKSTPGAASAVTPSTAANFGVATTGSGGPPATVNFNYAMPVNEAHYLAILQNNAYPFQIPGAVGTPPAYRSGAPVQALPFFNGSFYSSQMLHPSQLQQQQQPPPQQASHTQHGHQNQSTSSGSSSSQKHHSQQPQQRVTGGAAGGLPVPTAGLSSQSIPGSKSKHHHLSHQPQAETGCEDSPSTADSRVSQAGQKMVPGQNFPMPIHPPNFALISPAAAALGGSATHTEKQSASQQSGLKVDLTPSQAFAMSFTSLGGNAGAPPGLDFSSLAQNHPIFQSLPEAARQGYQITAAASAQAAQHLKKSQQILEDRSGGESTSTTVGGEEERKVLAACKGTMNVPQQSLNFSRPDSNPSMPSLLGNSVMENTPRTLTLIPANVNGGGISHRSSNSVLSSPPSTATVNAQHSQQQQQQLIQLQKQQQQQQQMIQLQKQQQHQLQHQLASRSKSLASSNSTSIYSERMPAGSTVTKFPPALAGFPQALIQGSSPSQSTQWKSSTKSATSAASSSHPVQSMVKTGIPQQQTRISQQSVPPQVHQTQISFGMNSVKMAAPAGQQLTGGNSMPSLSSAPTNIVIGSPQNSAASKTSASGSPRASTNSKSGPPLPATSLPLQQQASAKISPSSSSRKSSPVSNRNVPSILGQPHISSSQSSTINKQQQHQTHQKQPYPQAQLFFSNPYMPMQSSQSNASNAAAAAAVAASYYQRRPTEQLPSQGPNLVPGSTGMLSLCPTTLSLVGAPVTVDPAKAVVAASSMKGMQQAGLLQHAGTASFPYIHGMPSVSIKPAEQKPAAVII